MKNLHIPDIGYVSIRKYKQSKSLRATLQPDGSFLISIPWHVSYKEAINFLQQEKSKILDLKKQQKAYNRKYDTYLTGRTYSTKFHRFIIDYHREEDFRLQKTQEKTYTIYVPHKYKVEEEEIQFYLRQIVRDIYRYEAKTYIIPRTVMYAQKFGFDFRNITIKNIKSRWGSCSSKKNLNFNLNLMRLPDELIDYVILHELTHLKVQNHSADFWRLLSTMMKNPRQFDQQLNQYSLRHFAT
jgi:predicted metal-dependent hydrolase